MFVNFFLLSCATYQTQISPSAQNSSILQSVSTDFSSLYLIGDTGAGNSSRETLQLLQQNFAGASANDFLVFLGDNAYPQWEKDSPEAQNALTTQLEAAKTFPGKVIFLPGNHDWRKGLKALEDEEDFINDRLKGKNHFLPENGCPIETVDISENAVLIIVDSQWFLEDWNDHPKINTRCGQIFTREEFLLELEDEVTDNQGKTVIIAMHHPIFTNGPHGGKLGAKSHLFPLDDKTPLPIVGSLISQVRATSGVSPQDLLAARYLELANRVEIIARRNEKVILVSGHEHNLQYINNRGLMQIVSGAGSKSNPVALGEYGIFASGKQGFGRLDLLTNGGSNLYFYETEKGNTPAFQSMVFQPVQNFQTQYTNSFPATVSASVYRPEETEKSKFFETVWGNHYREVYRTAVSAKTALLDTLYGGLTPVRQGGGHQTLSLRLADKQGNEYTMRSLRKSAVRYFQTVVFKDKFVLEEFKNSGAERLLMDFYTAAHPFAPLAVPDLADAVGVMQERQVLFFVPKQSALGAYNQQFGDELYFIEKRIKEDPENGAFKGADDIESTSDLFEKMRKDEKYKLDENAYIRARLFDMLIGDFDRHGDQWRWAEFKQENGDRVYKPIPRDRDQAFVNYDGALMTTLRSLVGITKQFHSYDEQMEDVKWMNNAAITLDRTLLKNTSRQDWLREAAYIQEQLNESDIEKAFGRLPNEVQGPVTDDIKQKLKGRKANLRDIAQRYYDYYARLGIITGTDKDDIFEIERLADGQTRVRVYRNKKGEKADLMADRTFKRGETKEIWLYGLDDDDIFESTGKADAKIKIRIIGGQNNDIYNFEDGNRITVYDYKSLKNTVQSKKGANLKLSDNYNNNTFEYKRNILTHNLLLPTVGYNPDDGIAIGLTDIFTLNGFERNPFTQKHTFSAKYFFATQGFDGRYQGEFGKFIGLWNGVVALRGTTENFTQNFFGFGNETTNRDDSLGVDYNRVKTSILSAELGLKRTYASGLTLDLRGFFESVEVEDSPNRFITNNFPTQTTEPIFDRKNFAGIKARVGFESYDNKVSPSRGMNFLLETGYTNNVDDARNFIYLKPEVTFYNPLSRNKQLTLRSYVKSHLIFDDDFEFYQAAALGGEDGLRGFRFQRFTGKRSLAFGGDVRYAFNDMRLRFFVPLQLGIYGGYDLGRVWMPNDSSKLWHDSFGGGFWLNGTDVFALNTSLFGSADGVRFAFGFRFDF